MYSRRAFLGSLILLAADPPRVRFLRPPSVVTDQFAVRFYLHVPLHDDNRLLAFAAFDGDIRVDYSERDLASERRKTVWEFTRRLPPGEMLLVAAVYGSQGERGRATHRVSVVGFP